MRRMTTEARAALVRAQEHCRARGGQEITVDDLGPALSPDASGGGAQRSTPPEASPEMLPFSAELQLLLTDPPDVVLDVPELHALRRGGDR